MTKRAKRRVWVTRNCRKSHKSVAVWLDEPALELHSDGDFWGSPRNPLCRGRASLYFFARRGECIELVEVVKPAKRKERVKRKEKRS